MSKVAWTKEQLQAIQQTGSNILVAAGAGSGKTAVLVERMIDKIIQQKIDIDQLLIVTFTNAAASEMKERILEAIYQKIEEEPQNMHLQKQIHLMGRANICTIDSFCLEVVKNNFYEIGQSYNFRIADNAELELLKQEVLDDLFDQKYEIEDKDFLNLLETYTTYSSDDPLKELILNSYQFIQSHPFPIEWLEEQVEKYHLEEKQDIDFAGTEWGNIILNSVKENLIDAKAKLEQIKSNIDRFEELKKYVLVLNQDIETIEQIIQCETWEQVYHLNLTRSFEKWPIDKKVDLEEKEIAKDKRNEIKKQVNKILEIVDCNSKQALQDICYMYKPLCAFKNFIIEYDEALKKAKKEKNIVDFSDIEHMALKLLLQKNEAGQYEPSEVAKRYQNKFAEIAIDEYQDSNLVQEKILTSISNGHNIFMVGDVKQSIYKFRQARPELFLDKYETYHFISQQEENNDCAKKIQLFKNFRSRENILDTVNFIFQKMMSKKLGDIQYEKEEFLNLGANFEDSTQESIGTNTEILIVETKEQPMQQEELAEDEAKEVEEPIENIELEAKFVAQKIKEILDSKQVVFDKKVGYRPITYKDIVILLRSTKDKANLFEQELIDLKIPVYSDTSLEYLSSIEIETMMNLLKVIDNPTMDIPLVCVLRSMIGGFTDNELIQIRFINSGSCFYDAMKQYLETENDALKSKIEAFFEKIRQWKQESEYLELDELIWKIYMDTGYYNYVSLMPDGILRQANLKLLFEKAKQYEEASFSGLYHFIHFIDKVRTSSKDLSSAKLIGENENVVRIMSIHKSKGLEFPLVFLCNSNKKFNVQDLNSPILLHQDLGLGVNYIDSSTKVQYATLAKEAVKIKSKEEMISEEMRILYVALTRAKEKLIITGVSKDLEKSLNEKQALLSLYTKESKINTNLLKKYQSYLDWIELAYLKEKTDTMKIEKIAKENIGVSSQDALPSKRNIQTCNIEEMLKKEIEPNHLKEIQAKLNWEYPYIALSKIEAKSSVSKIKQASIEEKPVMMKSPAFLKEEKSKFTGAQKGTLIHLCMQHLKIGEDYTQETLQDLVTSLCFQKKITEVEAKNIDFSQILNFTKSNIWQELKNAKLVEREKPFYITIPADEIYQNGLKEEILVQGIIDLFYINSQDEFILVDYKTDYVTTKEELIQKYAKQLELYKRALEEAMNKKVSKTYIYSTHFGEEILIK